MYRFYLGFLMKLDVSSLFTLEIPLGQCADQFVHAGELSWAGSRYFKGLIRREVFQRTALTQKIG